VLSHLKFNLAVGWNKTAAESDKGMVVNPKLQVRFLNNVGFLKHKLAQSNRLPRDMTHENRSNHPWGKWTFHSVNQKKFVISVLRMFKYLLNRLYGASYIQCIHRKKSFSIFPSQAGNIEKLFLRCSHCSVSPGYPRLVESPLRRQLQSHMSKYSLISRILGNPFLIYDFAPAPFRISIYTVK
jgi:hypothetical protein